MEKDDGVKGQGNSYTTEFRQYDPRVGRWLTIDPKMNSWESPYVGLANTPIIARDPRGDFIPVIIGGYILAEYLIAAVATYAIVHVAVNSDLVKQMQESYPKPWYTDRPRVNIPEYKKQGSLDPYPPNGPKIARWIVATGTAARLIKQIYDQYDQPVPETDSEGQFKTPVSLVPENEPPSIEIDINITDVEMVSNKKVEITVTADVFHKVEKGEYLEKIAKENKVSVDQIVKWNSIEDPNKIQAGGVLKVNEFSEKQVVDVED